MKRTDTWREDLRRRLDAAPRGTQADLARFLAADGLATTPEIARVYLARILNGTTALPSSEFVLAIQAWLEKHGRTRLVKKSGRR